MVFWEEIRWMKKMLMSASYIVERWNMKKRLAGGVIRPAGGGVPMRQSQLPKRSTLMAQRFLETIDDDAS
jgi:hypothetical protein